MNLENDIKLDFSDVLIRPKRSTLSSRADVSIERTFKFKHSNQTWRGVPIISANMDHTGTIEMATELSKHGLMTALHKHYDVKTLIDFFNTEAIENIFFSMGISESDQEKFNAVKKETRINKICIDVPSAYLEIVVDTIKRTRDENPNIVIMAGNVCTGEMTEALILAGADIIKTGIGSGGACLTRSVAGVGVPQFSAILDTADAAHGLGGMICSDGGITNSGDMCKAFAANSDFVMMGSQFAGHDECNGDILYDENGAPTHMKFYGMSSKTANEKYSGGLKKYRASEGRELLVPYKGPIENTVFDYLGGLRSCMTYTGSKKLKELSKRATFIRVNNQINTSMTKY